jgi:hypothetical protein
VAERQPFVISTHSWHYRTMRLAVRIADRAERALGGHVGVKEEFEFGDDLTLGRYIGSMAYAAALVVWLVPFATAVYLGGVIAALFVIIVPAGSIVSTLAQYPLIPWDIVNAFWIAMAFVAVVGSVIWWFEAHPWTPRAAVIIA